ncbi:MAG: glycosyltransferase family 4 protein [Thermoleophilia bacterium]
MSRLRLAVVTPRYGPRIGGGAEGLARWVAHRLSGAHDVTVLTTRAQDYRTWRDHYPEGTERDGAVVVRRFSVPRPRDPARHDRWYAAAVLDRLDDDGYVRWMHEQGPNSPGLLEVLARDGGGFDAVLFVPYLYATTWDGLPLVAERSVLIPALHDEPAAAFPIMDRTFRLARGLAFSTPEEAEFCRRRFGELDAEQGLVGCGVEVPDDVAPWREDVPYVLYLGRIDPSKGCADLLRMHGRAAAGDPAFPRLVMAGSPAMPLPEEPWLDGRGFVEDDVKHSLLAGAVALVLPSPYESLSIAVLESWGHGRPVVVNGASPVLVGQARRAQGGLWYRDDAEYRECVAALAADARLADGLGAQGRHFARTQFSPDAVGERLERLLYAVTGRREAVG